MPNRPEHPCPICESHNVEVSPLGYSASCDDCGHFWRIRKLYPRKTVDPVCVELHCGHVYASITLRNRAGHVLYNQAFSRFDSTIEEALCFAMFSIDQHTTII